MADATHGDTITRSREKNFKRKDSETRKERYKNCELLNLIQHIDIHGTFCSSYHENRRKCADSGALAVTSVTLNAPGFLSNNHKGEKTNNRLDKLTVATKHSSLYPGHDILSKKQKMKSLSARARLI